MAEQHTTNATQQQLDNIDEVITPARLHHINLKAVKFDEMRTSTLIMLDRYVQYRLE